MGQKTGKHPAKGVKKEPIILKGRLILRWLFLLEYLSGYFEVISSDYMTFESKLQKCTI